MTDNGREENDRACCLRSDIVPIKRYPNRRFYDRKSSRYVTLQDIEELVRGGQTIEVRDSRSDEDLTRVVLTQILLERQPERMEMFPIPLLHTILRANELSLEVLRVFMKLSMATLESFQAPRTLSPFASPFEWMRMFLPGFTSPSLPGPRKPDEPREVAIETPGATVAQLSRRVAELEGRLRQLESGSPPAPDQDSGSQQQHRPVRGLEDHTSK